VKPSTAILIPSFNSNLKLSALITEIREYASEPIIIVDDGSKVPIAIGGEDVEVIRNDLNMGKGFSLRRGFDFARKIGYSHVVTMDSDHQHAPSELPLFLGANLSNDFVLGYREKDQAMPPHRKFSNGVTSSIISKIIKFNVHDSQCGFRRYYLESLRGIDFSENGFQFESEVLIKVIKADTAVEQVKISTIYDKNNKSYIKHVSDTVKFIRLILRSLVGK